LYQDGIFAQWIHSYDIDNSILDIVFKTVFTTFPHAVLYRVGGGDILVVASPSPLKLSAEKFNTPFVKKIYSSLGVYEVEDLYLSQLLSEEEFKKVALLSHELVNSLYKPQMIYKTNKSLFLGTHASLFGIAYKTYYLDTQTQTDKMKAFDRLKEEDWKNRCINKNGFNFLCDMALSFINFWTQFQASENSTQKFEFYLELRKRGLIPYDSKVLFSMIEESLKNKDTFHLSSAINELLNRGLYDDAKKIIKIFKDEELIDFEDQEYFESRIEFAILSHKEISNDL